MDELFATQPTGAFIPIISVDDLTEEQREKYNIIKNINIVNMPQIIPPTQLPITPPITQSNNNGAQIQ